MAKEEHELKSGVDKDNNASEQKPSLKPIPTSYLLEAFKDKEQNLFSGDDDFIFNFEESDMPPAPPAKVKATNEKKKKSDPIPPKESLAAQKKGIPIPTTVRTNSFIDQYSSLPRIAHIAKPFNEPDEIELGSSPYQPGRNFISM